MNIGLSIPMVGDATELVELGAIAENAGWDGFFLWDHIHFDPDTRPAVHDPWVLLGAVAVRTSRIRLGTLVTPVPRRRPWKLAREVTTLDHLSSGRAVLGVGLGNPPAIEYGSFGEPTEPRIHAAMLDEALPILDRFLRGERVDHDGPYYRVHARLGPPAVQRPRPPIWVAATLPRRRPVERARRWDGIVPLSSTLEPLRPEEVAAFVQSFQPRPGYDIVAALGPDSTAEAFRHAGATWLIDGPAWGEPFEDLRRRVALGPPS